MRPTPFALCLPGSPRRRVLNLTAALLLLGLPGTTRSQKQEEPPVQVLTNHNDNARTGANLRETRLNTQNVAQPDTFGKLFSLTVDGQVYAQPLYMSQVEIAGKGVHNVVFIATAHDSVYAFDADDHQGPNALPLWHVRFVRSPADPAAESVIPPPAGTTPVRSADYDNFLAGAYKDLTPEIGIIGTPVIDPKLNRLFVVAAMREKGRYRQCLHALDISSGKDSVPPVEIGGSVEGIGDGGANNRIPFYARQHLQRPGLLFTQGNAQMPNGIVYVAFGSHGDLPVNGVTLGNLFNLLPGYHGWLFAYDAKNLTPLGLYNSTPNGGTSLGDLVKGQPTPAGGGIWMSGAGPAADAAGNLYFSTGNGTSRSQPFSVRLQKLPAGPQHGKSRVRLSEHLVVGRATNNSTSDGNTCSYLQFDLPEVTFIPQSAMLTLTVPESTATNASSLVQVYYLPDAQWDASSLTWDNAPGLNQDTFQSTGELVSWHRIAPKKGTITFDLTNFLTRLQREGGRKRITLQLMSMNTDGIRVDFISSRRHNPQHVGEPFLTLVSYPK